LIKSIPSAWKSHLKTGTLSTRDDRTYINLRNARYPDIARDCRSYVDRGDCESTTAPTLRSETSATTSNATFARSSGWSHRGAYSYLLTKTNAAGTEAYVALQDGVLTTDMHGFIAGETVDFIAWIYGSGLAAGDVLIRVQQYYAATWNSTTLDTCATSGTEEKLYGTITLNSACAAVRFEIAFKSTVAINHAVYVDDIEIYRYPTFTLAREDNLIDRGNCESTTLPGILGEIGIFDGTSAARSSEQKRSGDYSIKLIGDGDVSYLAVTDNINTKDLHGICSGETIEAEAYVYVPSVGGPALSEVTLQLQYYTTAWVAVSVAVSVADTFQKLTLSHTLPNKVYAWRCYVRISADSDPDEYIYVDDIRVTRHSVPGSHYLSGGYTEHLVTLPDTFTLRVKFKPNFAYDIGSQQYIIGWYVSATQEMRIYYGNATDDFRVAWEDNGTIRSLNSAQYDNGTSHRNINQWIELIAAIDLTTGSTAGSALYMNGTKDDSTWSGNIDAKTTVFNKLQIRAYNGTAGDYQIAYCEMIPNYVATDADVANDFANVTAERIWWSFDGHGTGEARVNVSRFVQSMYLEKGVANRLSGAHSANTMSATLWNLSGQFSDDQYAVYNPSLYQFNGTVDQKYLRRRGDVTVESWYNGDFDTVFKGRLSESGFSRTSQHTNLSSVSISAADSAMRLAEGIAGKGRIHDNVQMVDACRGNSLLHLAAQEGRPYVKQYLAINRFEEATITGAWVQGANTTLSRQTTNLLFGSAHGRIVVAGGAGETHQSVTFAATERLHVGQSYTLMVWLLSSAAAAVVGGIGIYEYDSGGTNDSSVEDIALAGGEGYVLHTVTHTITDSDSIGLLVQINGDNGDTIDIGGAMLIPGTEAIGWFAPSSYELGLAASGGEVSSDDADLAPYEIFGFDVDAYALMHPWRRVTQYENIWNLIKSVANATVPRYIGFSECGTFFHRAVLADGFSEPIAEESIDETVVRAPVSSELLPIEYNRVIGHAQRIQKWNQVMQMWSLRSSGAYDVNEDGYVAIDVADGTTWPDADLYALYGNDIAGTPVDATLPTMQSSSIEQLNAFQMIVRGIHQGTAAVLNAPKDLLRMALGIPTSSQQQPTATTPTAHTGGYELGIEYQYGSIDAWREAMSAQMESRLYPNYQSRMRGGMALIGVRGASLIHKSTESSDGLSSLTIDKFDYETHPDGALIRMSNSSGGTITLKEMTIRGRPVTALTGDEGYVVDDMLDTESIARHGERAFLLEGPDFVDQTQIEEACEYYWKYTRASKHMHQFECFGTWHWLQPATWYRLTIGLAGETEYVDSIVELYNVRIGRSAGEHGQSVIMMREVEEQFKLDSNIFARMKARGYQQRYISSKPILYVASQYSTTAADIYCDGTADDVEIQAAIDAVHEVFAGGTVHLLPGTYNTTAALTLYSNVILEGEGVASLIKKNCNDYAVKFVGGAGTEVTSAVVRDLMITKDAADSNSKYLVYLDYADACSILNATIDGGHTTNIYVSANCENNRIVNVISTTSGARGIDVRGNETTIDTCTADTNTTDGIYVAATDCVISSNNARNNSGYGIYIDGLRNSYRGNQLYNNTSTAPTVSYDQDFVQMVDGTADQVEINEAITHLSSGGEVVLSRGAFALSAAIAMASNVVLRGPGHSITITKNCDDYAVKFVGGAGTEVTNAELADVYISRNVADTNSKYLIYMDYADDCRLSSVFASGGYTTNIYVSANCERTKMANTGSDRSGARGFDVRGSYTIMTQLVAYDNTTDGIYIAATDCSLAGSSAANNSNYGIYIDGLRNGYAANHLYNNTKTAPTVGYSEDFIQMVDGTSDEDEINEAINYYASGGNVWLSQGQFKIDGSIVLKSGTELYGEGYSTDINTNFAGADEAIQGDGGSGSELVGMYIHDLRISKTDTTNHTFIDLDYCDDVIIERCYFVNAHWLSLYAQYCDNIRISNCNFNNLAHATNAMCYLVQTTKAIVDNTRFYGAAGYGLLMQGAGSGVTGSEAVVKHNFFDDTNGVLISEFSTAVVQGNTVKNDGVISFGHCNGTVANNISDAADGILIYGTCYAVQIEGNSVVDSTTYGIKIDDATCTYCVVSNNTIYDPTAEGILIEGKWTSVNANTIYGGTDGISVANAYNIISQNEINDSGDDGIYGTADAENCNIVGNRIDAVTDDGIYWLAENAIISSNSVGGGDRAIVAAGDYTVISSNSTGNTANDGIVLSGSHGSITGNVVYSSGDIGIYILAVTCLNNTVTGNRSSNSTNSNYTNNGTGTTATGNDFT